MFQIMTSIPDGFLPAVVFLIKNNWQFFLYGLMVTLIVSLLGTLFGLILGMPISMLRNIKIHSHDRTSTKVFKRINLFIWNSYVQYIRGTPMMVQAILVYYGLRSYNIALTPIFAGVLVITINTSAYIAEILRAGIQSVDPGQNEAARSIGLNERQTMMHIILPQALRNAIPAIGNELVANIKDSAVLNAIAVTDLFFQANKLNGVYYRQLEPFFIISLIYLALTLLSSKLLKMIENHIDNKGARI